MEKIKLSKQQKILMLDILKSGEITREQANEIIKPFNENMTIPEAKEFLRKIENDY